MRNTLGVEIGSDVQAYDADLANIASSGTSANSRTFLAQANYANMRNTLGVQINSDVQAYSNRLAQIAGLTNCNNFQIIEQRNGAWTCQADNTRRRLIELDAGINHPLFASDLRMKNDVSSFPETTSASKVISTLNIYSFKFKNTTNNIGNYGVSAKELYEKTNLIVQKGDDDEEPEDGLLKNPYKINTQSLTAFMLQSIKELKLENNQLKKRLKRLEEQLGG